MTDLERMKEMFHKAGIDYSQEGLSLTLSRYQGEHMIFYFSVTGDLENIEHTMGSYLERMFK